MLTLSQWNQLPSAGRLAVRRQIRDYKPYETYLTCKDLATMQLWSTHQCCRACHATTDAAEEHSRLCLPDGRDAHCCCLALRTLGYLAHVPVLMRSGAPRRYVHACGHPLFMAKVVAPATPVSVEGYVAARHQEQGLGALYEIVNTVYYDGSSIFGTDHGRAQPLEECPSCGQPILYPSTTYEFVYAIEQWSDNWGEPVSGVRKKLEHLAKTATLNLHAQIDVAAVAFGAIQTIDGCIDQLRALIRLLETEANRDNPIQ